MVPDPHALAASKIGLALAVGLLVGFEREWSNKDAGIRTCAIVALSGALAALLGPAFLIAGFAGALMLVAFVNVRTLRAAGAVEITTSAAVLLVYILGAVIGAGHYFTAVTAAIAATLLLAWKVELHRFAGELKPEEVHAAVWLALLAFVVYPLLPDRTIDPWGLVNPHTVWVAVIVVAGVGFINYVLMRLYSARGLYYSAVLGGLVSTTPTMVELGASLRQLGGDVVPMSVTITLLATLAMFARNLILLVIFAPSGTRSAWLPLLAMAALSGVFIWRRGRKAPQVTRKLELESPISLRRVALFGVAFLVIQAAATLAQRHFGHQGTYLVAILGGLVNSASTTAAVGELAAHHSLPALAAGVSTVLASLASAAVNAPLMNRVLGGKKLGWENRLLTWSVVALGVVVLGVQGWW